VSLDEGVEAIETFITKPRPQLVPRTQSQGIALLRQAAKLGWRWRWLLALRHFAAWVLRLVCIDDWFRSSLFLSWESSEEIWGLADGVASQSPWTCQVQIPELLLLLRSLLLGALLLRSLLPRHQNHLL